MLKRYLDWPARRILDGRFAQVIQRLVTIDARLGPIESHLGLIERIERDLGGHLGLLQGKLEELRQQGFVLEEHTSAAVENSRALRQSMAGFEPAYQIPPLENRVNANLTWPIAEFLNWALGPSGYAAQAGVFFNEPVYVTHETGRVRVSSVNERAVEHAFVHRALAAVEPGAKVLDIGGSESTLALGLCGLGYPTAVVDPRGYPLEHPLLEVHSRRYDELPDDVGEFDAAIALSAIEHFGLASYEGDVIDETADVKALEDLPRRLNPGGLLVLTVPLGLPNVDDFQRRYDGDGVRNLLEGWEITSLDAAWRTSPTRWEAGPVDEPLGEHGVALATARAPAQ